MYIKLFEDNPNTRDILKVVEVLKAGGIIIYPTDTIYEIGCDIIMSKLCACLPVEKYQT